MSMMKKHAPLLLLLLPHALSLDFTIDTREEGALRPEGSAKVSFNPYIVYENGLTKYVTNSMRCKMTPGENDLHFQCTETIQEEQKKKKKRNSRRKRKKKEDKKVKEEKSETYQYDFKFENFEIGQHYSTIAEDKTGKKKKRFDLNVNDYGYIYEQTRKRNRFDGEYLEDGILKEVKVKKTRKIKKTGKIKKTAWLYLEPDSHEESDLSVVELQKYGKLTSMSASSKKMVRNYIDTVSIMFVKDEKEETKEFQFASATQCESFIKAIQEATDYRPPRTQLLHVDYNPPKQPKRPSTTRTAEYSSDIDSE